MYKNIVDYNDHLGLITFITFICFVIVANMNCFIFNPSFSVPMFFLISLFIGAISSRGRTWGDIRFNAGCNIIKDFTYKYLWHFI